MLTEQRTNSGRACSELGGGNHGADRPGPLGLWRHFRRFGVAGEADSEAFQEKLSDQVTEAGSHSKPGSV
ncbi:hypothetical protein scyTo_0007496 [Scyliorhinus torazame]|uniref:Uncharacterized protein n=1 Tax=Scyliorhinus torazame TaxID=75743 RepID=A0A401NTK1_SCYTO|nr:hypothetical protein [Scyliorhinus torazame]